MTDDLPYGRLEFPPARPDRPYVFTDMVTTIDGKIVSGEADEDVSDLGSREDREVMKRLERSADAILAGAATVRASSRKWNPETPIRIVATRSGNVPSDSRFVTGGQTLFAHDVDFVELLQKLRTEFNVERLLVAGGSEINGSLLKLDLVDEVFWTIAPKIKLGRNLPGYAGGEPLGRDSLLTFELVEHRAVANEIFARYRRRRPSERAKGPA